MKALGIIALLVVLAVAIYVLTLYGKDYIEHRRKQNKLKNAKWELKEESDGEMIYVYAVHPATQRLMIDAVAFARSDFDYRIEEVRAAGREKVIALNSGRKQLR